MTSIATTPANSIRLHPRRFLLPLAFFLVFSGLDEDSGRKLCEDGSLWPAFNLATGIGEGHRLALHVWREAVLQWPPSQAVRLNGDLDKIIAAVLPSQSPGSGSQAAIGATELAFRFCCSVDLIANLVRSGELRTFGKPSRPKATPRILQSSAVEFLKRRLFQ
jgi:hypothetical protein